MTERLAGSGANELLDRTIRDSLSRETIAQLRSALDGGLHQVYLAVFVVALIALAVAVTTFPRGSVQDLQGAEGGRGSPRPVNPASDHTGDPAAG